jgi:hypothetical protein
MSKVTIFDAFKMLQALMTANNMSYNAIMDVVRFTNACLGAERIPESEYIFKRVCLEKLTYEKQYFCTSCEKDLYRVPPSDNKCPDCGSKSMDYFVSMPIKENIQTIMKRNLQDILEYRRSFASADPEILTDIQSGDWFKNIEEQGEFITININTDGVAPYNSSKRSSLWPIFLSLNDLPPSMRYSKQNVVAAGFWLSEYQPNFKLFLKPFIDELNHLYQKGLDVNNKNYRVLVCSCCVDSPARAKVLEIKQFNGYYGCTFCLHPSVNQRYPGMNVENRTLEKHLQHIEELENLPATQRKDNSIMGVKGRTPLLDIPKFDPMLQCPVDYMHCVLLGVTKKLLSLWCSTQYSKMNFYMKNERKRILDQRFGEMKIFSEITRKSTSVTDKFHTWKSSEFFFFLMYASKHCLAFPVLSPVYFQHFLLFQESMEVLCNRKITKDELEICRQKLTRFIEDFQELYGEVCMVYNIHLLTHLIDTVRLFGPVFTTSLFVYESSNGVVGRFLSGPKGPSIQISMRYFMFFTNYYTVHRKICDDARHFINNVMEKSYNKYRHTNYYKKWKQFQLPDNIVNPYDDGRDFRSYEKLYVQKRTISTLHQSDKNKCYNDSYIFVDGILYEISQILVENENDPDTFFILGRRIFLRFSSYQ